MLKKRQSKGPLPNANRPGYIFNHKTERWVKRDGIVGRRVAREMSRGEATEHIRHHSIGLAIEFRNLISSNISDSELTQILKQIVNIQLDNNLVLMRPEPIPITISEDGPTVLPVLPAAAEPIAAPIQKTIKPRRRFGVRPAPPMCDTTTDYDTDLDD